MWSGLAVPGDGVAGIFKAARGAGAVPRAVLEADLVRLADLDLLEALCLLEALGAGALGAVMPLVVTAMVLRDVIECNLR